MSKILVVAADEAVARILASDVYTEPLREVQTLTAPTAHATEAELRTDARGRRAAGGRMVSSTVEPAAKSAEHEEGVKFARRVAQTLLEQLREHRYDEVRVAAAPQFLGMLRQQYANELRSAITLELSSNYVKADGAMLKEKLIDAKRPVLR